MAVLMGLGATAPVFASPAQRIVRPSRDQSGGLAVGPVGVDLGLASFDGPVGRDGEEDAGLPPPTIIPGIGADTPCVAPQIIQIGRGLRQWPATRVVYGLPPCR